MNLRGPDPVIHSQLINVSIINIPEMNKEILASHASTAACLEPGISLDGSRNKSWVGCNI